MAEPPRWMVSVEGPPVAARARVVERLHTLAGAPGAAHDMFASLVTQFKAAAAQGGPRHVVVSPPWWRSDWRLCGDLAKALSRRLGVAIRGHVAVVLKAEEHEAFEHCMESGLPRPGPESQRPNPFPTQIVPLDCPPYVDDNPPCLHRFLKNVEVETRWIFGR